MAAGRAIGVAGIQVRPGAHICGMYRGAAERDAILVAFLNAGLAAGDKCICVIDA
ncbi:MAG: eukaryotic-like serine/threonine-protein kinase, partial [Actinomycetota bacterium]|nr:eukaryotic-like serine/threonine-protein kinase [Actinomycetota bacterium]